MDGNDRAPSQSELAYAKIHEAIRSGVFAPGDRIREAELAKRTGLSRTPVRDALRRLETEGIIEHRAHTGAAIRSLTHPEIVELYEMRMVLESAAAEFAAQHATEAEIDEMCDLNEAMMQAAGDAREAARLNANLHQCLCRAARNRFLLQSVQALNRTLLLLGPTTLDDEGRVALVYAQHGAIIDALQARDGGAAARAAGEHIGTSLRQRLKGLRE